ncbi:MAG: hypothetical protein AB1405_02075 [Bdellovibrionota bacterium]
MDRNEAIREIKAALKRRSGRAWSVTGGRGTAWGWITIHALPSRRVEPCDYMSDQDRTELAKLLALDRVDQQGVSIAAADDFRREYVDRANGRPPSVIGKPYWD